MPTDRIHEVLAEAIVGRHLLTHPFYRRWEAGSSPPGELAAYAEQYRHIERELPATLEAIARRLPEGGHATWSRRTWLTSGESRRAHGALRGIRRGRGRGARRRAAAVDGGVAGPRSHRGST